jgi:uncharacterized integral membrane protein
MKKVKIALWIIIFGFVGLVIFENKNFFMQESQLVLDLGFVNYQTPLLKNAIFFVAFFLLGILISYFFSLFKHYKDAKTIKTLKAKESSLVEAVSTLEKQVAQQQPESSNAAPAETVPEKPVEVVPEMK